MKLSIAQVKCRLTVGTEYTGEFIGPLNTRVVSNVGPVLLTRPEAERITRRKVVKQTKDMASEFLTGPKQGQTIYLNWAGVTAREENGSIILTQNFNDKSEDFLKITL
jgi:hypothetical protein